MKLAIPQTSEDAELHLVDALENKKSWKDGPPIYRTKSIPNFVPGEDALVGVVSGIRSIRMIAAMTFVPIFKVRRVRWIILQFNDFIQATCDRGHRGT